MKLDLDLYSYIHQNGMKLVSPATDIANQSIGALTNVEQLLNPISLPGVDLDVIERTKNAISSANMSMNNTISHISANVNKTLSISSIASQANQIDAFLGGVPSSCFNTDAIMGMVMGAANDLLSYIGDKANQINKAIADFMAGLTDSSQLDAFLSSLSDEIDDLISSVEAFVNAEKALWDEVIEKIKASSLAQTLTQLWNNPCTRAILEQTVPDDMKQFLPSL